MEKRKFHQAWAMSRVLNPEILSMKETLFNAPAEMEAKYYDGYAAALRDGYEGHPLPKEEVLEWYIKGGMSALRPVPIRSMGGKVRVVTLHPAEEVLVARRITKLWLKQLRKLVVTKDMLKGQTVTLLPQDRSSHLFSADLSKATDYISHDLAQRTARLLNERLGRPQDNIVTDMLLGPHYLYFQPSDRFPSPERTNSGIHMGQGPTWVILSLLNSYAAWKAGARRETYRICGDDLAGFWPKNLVRRYTHNIEALGMVVNHHKSFYGIRGVFCERLVEVTDGIGTARDIGHLSAMTAGKLNGGFTHAALAVADEMEKISRLHPIVDQVRRKLVPGKLGPGRVRFGGNGFGTLPLGGLARLARKGALQLVTGAQLPPKLLKDLDPLNEGPVAIPDLLIELKSAYQAASYLDNKKLKTTPMTRERLRAVSKVNSHRGVTRATLVSLVKSSSLNARNRKTALSLLRSGIPPPGSKRRRRLENILSRPNAVRFTTKEYATYLIRSVAPPGWKIKTIAASS
jgi:hypothetical protein